MEENKYYVYVHRDKDGNTFYVGKGCGDRSNSCDRNEDWADKIIDDGNEFNVEIIAENLSEKDAKIIEACIIKALQPNLTNIKTVTVVINPTRYVKHSYDTQRHNKIKKLIQTAMDTLGRNELTLEERAFAASSKFMDTKNLTDDELEFRSHIAIKLKRRAAANNRIESLKNAMEKNSKLLMIS